MSRCEEGRGGAYLLILRLDSPCSIDVGALGRICFPEGDYAYAGSALVSLDSRIERHFSAKKKIHWHIDRLRARARPVEALVLRSRDDIECTLNTMVGTMEGAIPFAFGFGCSDCDCDTHLHRLEGDCLSHLERFIPERLRPLRGARSESLL